MEYDFEVHILACIITSYDITDSVGDMTYTIGDPDQLSTSYLFDETPLCGYPETVTVTGLPTFVAHQKATADFLIGKTEEHSLDGVY